MTQKETDIQARLDFALQAARKAGELILTFYQNDDLAIDLKEDSSPVTAADRGAELLLRAEIGREFPDDGILGEEFDDKPSANGYRWILDPIDGTKSFMHGVPLFGTLIGIEFEKQLIVGVCLLPAMDEIVYASQGQGAWWQVGSEEPRRASVRSVDNLSEALFCFTEVEGWIKVDRLETFEQICRSSRITRGWGDCYGHILVATGRADVMIDPLLNPWDAAALLPILQEAGGLFVDWNGKPSIYSGNGFSIGPKLKDEVLAMLQPES